VFSKSFAVDFDGILCYDAEKEQDDDGERYIDFIKNAKPLYLPRKKPIPLIVTARIEKYREITEEWLANHNIQFDKLVMHEAKTLRERELDNISKYKAHHINKWAENNINLKPLIFFESDDNQAKQIKSFLTNKSNLVICPSSTKVY
jgi:uncharacterized HAD superfamily protein